MAETMNTTRRAVLKGAPAVALTFASGAAVQAVPAADPIIALYHEWDEARALWTHLAEISPSGEWDEPECQAAWTRKEDALSAMMRGRATSVEGIRLLAHAMWEEEGWTAEGPA